MISKPLVPYELSFLLHCYISSEPHPNIGSDTLANVASMFVNRGILTCGEKPRVWEVTELGRAWIAAILNTQVPRVAYLDAQGKEVKPR